MSINGLILKFVIVVICFYSQGCMYCSNILKDLKESFTISTGIGISLPIHAHCRVMPISIAIGAWHGYSVGLHQNGKCFLAREIHAGSPWSAVLGKSTLGNSYDYSRALCTELYAILKYDDENNLKYKYGRQSYFIIVQKEKKTSLKDLKDFFWISFACSIFVKIEVGFNVLEFCDFILGIFGMDILDDNNV